MTAIERLGRERKYIREDIQVFSDKWYSASKIRKIEDEYGTVAKRGKFSRKEMSIIKEFIPRYLSENKFRFEDFIDAIVHRKRKIKSKVGEIFKEVAKELGNGRPIGSVYLALQRMYHPDNYLGKWDKEDDLRLLHLFAIYGPDWKRISSMMGRTDLNCRDRYRNIQIGFNKGKWSREEEIRLLEIIDQLKLESPTIPFWVAVSEQMKTRSPIKCLTKWRESLLYRSNECPVWNDYEDFTLLNRMYEEGFEDEREISWSSLSKTEELSKWTPSRLSSRWRILKKRARSLLDDSLMDDLDTTLEMLLAELTPLSCDWIQNIPDGEQIMKETWSMIEDYKNESKDSRSAVNGRGVEYRTTSSQTSKRGMSGNSVISNK
jgi:hypothetical protein